MSSFIGSRTTLTPQKRSSSSSISMSRTATWTVDARMATSYADSKFRMHWDVKKGAETHWEYTVKISGPDKDTINEHKMMLLEHLTFPFNYKPSKYSDAKTLHKRDEILAYVTYDGKPNLLLGIPVVMEALSIAVMAELEELSTVHSINLIKRNTVSADMLNAQPFPVSIHIVTCLLDLIDDSTVDYVTVIFGEVKSDLRIIEKFEKGTWKGTEKASAYGFMPNLHMKIPEKTGTDNSLTLQSPAALVYHIDHFTDIKEWLTAQAGIKILSIDHEDGSPAAHTGKLPLVP